MTSACPRRDPTRTTHAYLFDGACLKSGVWVAPDVHDEVGSFRRLAVCEQGLGLQVLSNDEAVKFQYLPLSCEGV